MKLPIWLIPAGILLYFFADNAKNRILEKINFSFSGIGTDWRNLQLILKFTAVNPLPTPITLDSITGTVFQGPNRVQVANFFQSQPTVLQPGQNTISINAVPLIGNLAGILNNIRDGFLAKYRITSGPLSFSSQVQLFG